MTDADDPSSLSPLQSSLRAPRAAAVAGMVFAVILGTAIVLIRRVVPATGADAGSWLTSDQRRDQVTLALGLIPFAGIAFLWFIAVVRDHIGAREDRFFATVFLGSGFAFVAMLFAAGAVASGLVASVGPGGDLPAHWEFGRRLVFTLMNSYGLRMAAVFTVATTTLGGRLGLIPRWLVVVGYLSAVSLLLVIGLVPLATLLFPLWVLLLSVHILLAGRWQARPSAGT